MTYVVTQSCCADASCVTACPVNCIHPTPGEPGFATAEMLYVDPDSCVGCGACATACPVDAIKPHTALTPAQRPFAAVNADYYDCFPHLDRTPVAVVAPQRRLAGFETPHSVPRKLGPESRLLNLLADRGPRRLGPRARTFRVAVVGAGPAGLYTADELLKHPEITVDVYDKLPTPYGLVRAGVAPDHPHTKRVERLFGHVEQQPGFGYFLGVEVGTDVSLAELQFQYDAVVHAVGAAADQPLGVPGEDLPGSLSATDLVGWYNGHPDKQDLAVDLSHERAVVVGNGNVALDVARILTADPATLERTDIASLPWTVLACSSVREVVVLGRRGPAQAAFTLPELVGLSALTDVDVVVEGGILTGAIHGEGDHRSRILAELAGRRPRPGKRAIVLRFLTAPVAILGRDRVTGVEVARTRLETGADGRLVAVPSGETEVVETGLVLRSVGYRGRPVADLPFDEASGTVPHERGRVRPGLYVAGWVKRGPTGFIGTNKSDAQETVASILDDLDAGNLPTPVGTRESIAAVVAGRVPQVVDLDGWRAIDAEERRRGQVSGRPRVKIVAVEEMLHVASEAGRSSSVADGRRPVRRYASDKRRRRFEKRR